MRFDLVIAWRQEAERPVVIRACAILALPRQTLR